MIEATVFALAGVAILIGLGIWQLDRKVWKENLIATHRRAARRARRGLCRRRQTGRSLRPAPTNTPA